MNSHQSIAGKKDFLDGFKGLLCWFVMFGHFWHIYFGIKGDSPLKHVLFDAILSEPVAKHVFTATFWLYAFLVISGYLLSFSKVGSLKELISKVVKRFLRLFLPIFGAAIFVYAIQETIGFHVGETKEYFINTWFQQYYEENQSFKEMIFDAFHVMFFPTCTFNPPFWVISNMFCASLLIYICKYVDCLIKRRSHILPWLFLFIATLKDSQIILACMCGFMLGYYMDIFKRISKKTSLLFLSFGGLVFFCYKASSFFRTFLIVFCYTFCCIAL